MLLGAVKRPYAERGKSCVDSKCEKNEQVSIPPARGSLITIQSRQRGNAKGRKESDSLNRMPPWTSANNP